ncbi:MAG: hypothetical protein KY475_03735 [Planctomycetes bacterium]|nr:hypothetical protein [Planctomycetota bacterium]
MKKRANNPKDEAIRSAMTKLIRLEKTDGCSMADESLIAPAIRRWRSYARRNKKNKNQTLEHRAHDLNKALVELFPEHNYDPGCLRHIAESFAEILWKFDNEELARERGSRPMHATHANAPSAPCDLDSG